VTSAERAAENESTFRDLNEKLERRADELELGDGQTPYLCECDDERCTRVVRLTRDQYEQVRAHPRTFVLMAGHQAADDRIVRGGPDHVIVEKTGPKAALVEQRDPRS
jgi:hypothetical protein